MAAMTLPEGSAEKAVADAFHGVVRAMEFAKLFADMVDVTASVTRTANGLAPVAGDFTGLGLWKEASEKADKLAGPTFVQFVDQYSYLNSLVTVRIWTALEYGVEDLAIALLRRDDAWKQLPAVRESKTRLSDFIALEGRAQFKFLLEQLLTETKARHEKGVMRYEKVLGHVGLGGVVNADVRKVLLELVETRHVIVHRDGASDAQFVERCPWVPLWGRGRYVKVRRHELGLFANAALAYISELMVRLRQHGLASPEQEVDWPAALGTNLDMLAQRIGVPRPPAAGSETDWTLLATDLPGASS